VSNQRPERPEYFMNIALAVRERADCVGQKVGAIIVLDHRIMATGYNGTPAGMRNCSEGGCVRCANRDKKYVSGTGYDLCICVHAEQNAILAAARFGISIQGATIYTTVQPCFGCLKEMLQAGIEEVLFLHPWRSAKDADPDQQAQYEILASRLPKGIRQLEIHDPRADWARGGTPAPQSPASPSFDQHGMESR
jgi:dCMP deaminase